MHEKVLSPHSRQLLAALDKMKSPALTGWTLAGGTGLALHLGHRISDDFDFFRTDNMDLRKLHDVFKKIGPYETLQEAEHTFTVLSEKTKVSFFRISDPFIFKSVPYRFFSLADVGDIALMKLIAISGRGSRKDFVDIYTILRGGLTLQECFDELPRKYLSGRANAYHILKSLTYFEDVEKEPMPTMLESFQWEDCKAYFVRETHAITLS